MPEGLPPVHQVTASAAMPPEEPQLLAAAVPGAGPAASSAVASSAAAQQAAEAAAVPRLASEVSAADPHYFAAAHAGVLDRPPLSFLHDLYYDHFFRSTDTEYVAFAALRFPAKERTEIADRVLASVRTIGAFQAWYAVVWHIVRAGYRVAPIAFLLAASLTLVVVSGFARDPVALVLTRLIPLAALTVAWVGLRVLPRRWPANAVTLVVGTSIVWTLAQLEFVTHLRAPWGPGAVAAAVGSIACAIALLAMLLVAQALHQWTTFSKIRRYPTEEIVDSITALLVQFAEEGSLWKVLAFRRRVVEQLEWIARCFENEYVGRFTGNDAVSDPALRADGAAYAAGFRSWKRTIAFPAEDTADAFRLFMWQALRATALDRWSDLPRVTEAVAPASRRDRLAAQARSVASIGGPVAIALAVQLIPSDDPTFKTVKSNLLVTMGLWSAFSLLAMINPKQFETEASAAKVLGGLVTKV